MNLSKKKLCDGCGCTRSIWKNVTKNMERKSYCLQCWKYRKVPKPKPKVNNKPLAFRAAKRSQQENQYNKQAREWKEEHPHCEIGIPGRCTHKTHDVHHMMGKENDLLLDERYWKANHMMGKENDLLLDERYWKATCRACHEWCTIHTQEAIDLGFSLPRTTNSNNYGN